MVRNASASLAAIWRRSARFCKDLIRRDVAGVGLLLLGRYDDRWRDMAKFNEIWLDTAVFGTIWLRATTCGKIWRNSARFGNVWRAHPYIIYHISYIKTANAMGIIFISPAILCAGKAPSNAANEQIDWALGSREMRYRGINFEASDLDSDW